MTREPVEFVWRLENVIVIDGDTLRAHVDMGAGIWMLGHKKKGKSIRLAGLDTPENKKPTVAEYKAAKDWLTDKVRGKILKVVSLDNPEKWDRILGTVWVVGEDKSVNAQLLETGLAEPYDGGHKE